jgi:glycosyltransferase involved in cell wall biosynthesis
MPKVNVTVIIITKNEEKNIEKCLNACSPVSEIFVVDSKSNDRTVEIAKKFIPKKNVIDFQWNGMWPKKRQWSLLNLPISNEWVLMLDADMVPTKEFWNELNYKIK